MSRNAVTFNQSCAKCFTMTATKEHEKDPQPKVRHKPVKPGNTNTNTHLGNNVFNKYSKTELKIHLEFECIFMLRSKRTHVE